MPRARFVLYIMLFSSLLPVQQLSYSQAKTNISVEYAGHRFNVNASLTNGNIESIEVYPDFSSIVATVSTTDKDGELAITLPRDLIDAKAEGKDDQFIVTVDGQDWDFEEVNAKSTDRTLRIQVPAGTGEIEIIGTQVIPEFPLAELFALTASIAMVTVLLMRTQRQVKN